MATTDTPLAVAAGRSVSDDVHRATDALTGWRAGSVDDSTALAALTCVTSRQVAEFAGADLPAALAALSEAAFPVLADVTTGAVTASPMTDAVGVTLQRALSNPAVHSAAATPANISTLLALVVAEPHAPLCTTAILCVNNCTVISKSGQAAFLAVDGVAVLVDELNRARPASHLAAVVRYLMRVVPMSAAIKEQLVARDDLVTTLAATLGECVRRKVPPFPKGTSRVDLALFVLKLLYNLGDSFSAGLADTAREDMTQLGILLADCLHLPHHLPDALVLKRQVINLLMRMPDHYAHYLQATNCLEPLFDVFQDDVAAVVASSASDAAKDLTVLTTVLHNAAKTSKLFAHTLRSRLIPPLPADMPKPLAEPAALSPLADPAKAPVVWKHVLDILRAQQFRGLILMLNELVLVLCGDNVGAYAKHVGVGLGIETLMRKGAVPTPS